MTESNIIPILVLLPILGALVTLFGTPKGQPKLSGPIALICALFPLGVVIWMAANFPGLAKGADSGWHYTCTYEWLPNLGVKFMMGVDTISLWLIVLTAVLTPIAILASFQYIKERQAEFYAWMLALHAGMLGVFAARDILVFYLFFEFTLIPMFFIIGIWGGAERRKAAGKFFLFTFAGSVLTLASLLYISYVVYLGAHRLTFAMDDLYKVTYLVGPDLHPLMSFRLQAILFFGLLAGFAVKVPLFPVHTWLPLAHTEAPTAGSVILAGVLLKLGTYGILRFMLPVLPDATRAFAPWIAGVCIVGIIYGALVSWVQGDMKKLIAYSSVSHLGFCVLGMFALTHEGITGSVLYMLNHGLSTGALFLVVGMIYERYHTRDMNQVGGIVRRVPALGFFAVFFVLSSVALPGLNGFVSEFLVLLGTFVSGRGHLVNGHQYGNLGPAFAIPAATGVILGAVYLLYWTGRVVFGPLREPVHEHAHHDEDPQEPKGHEPVKDLSLREWAVLVPVALLVIYMGVYPKLVIKSLEAPVAAIAESLRMDKGTAAPVAVGDKPESPLAASVAAKQLEDQRVELEIKFLIPEIILLAAACVVTLLGLSKRDVLRRGAQVIAAVALAAGFFMASGPMFGDIDSLSFLNDIAAPVTAYFNPNFITMLACAIGLLTVLASWDMPAKADPSVPDSHYRGEFFGMMLFSLSGVAMIGKVNDLVWLFVALELVSIPTYILVATGRAQIVAQEAGVKYFFLGALAAAIFVFGFSYIYGATGSTRFVDIQAWFTAHPEMTPLALIGIIMVIVGVGYKIAAVPLHFYAPDVYQGAATPVTALLAFAPKTAGIVAIISMLSLFRFDYAHVDGRAILSLLTVISVLTMTVGNVLGLLQRNIKRIFAYSSIAHSGYMLVGLIAGPGFAGSPSAGIDATLFYLASYSLMNLSAFAVLIYLQGKADVAEDLDDLAGVAREYPFAALLLAMCLFSLIGMPLTIGFLGKLYLIEAALASGHTVLAVIVVINAAIAAAYYLKIIAAMYLREPLYPFAIRTSKPVKLAGLICAAGVVAFFFMPGTISALNQHGEVAQPLPVMKVGRVPDGRPAPGVSAAGAGLQAAAK